MKSQSSFHNRIWLACHINTSSRSILIWWVNTSLKAQRGHLWTATSIPLLALRILLNHTGKTMVINSRECFPYGRKNSCKSDTVFSKVITLFIPETDAKQWFFKGKKINDRDKIWLPITFPKGKRITRFICIPTLGGVNETTVETIFQFFLRSGEQTSCFGTSWMSIKLWILFHKHQCSSHFQ